MVFFHLLPTTCEHGEWCDFANFKRVRERSIFIYPIKIVPTNGFIRLSNIHRFVWSVWSEPDVLPYAFDTSEAWVFCRGERTVTERNCLKKFAKARRYTRSPITFREFRQPYPRIRVRLQAYA